MFKMYGSVPPMITPFDEQGDIDEKGLIKLVEYLSEEVDGLFICGSYGSGPMMSVEERKLVAEITIKTVAGRIPVIVHTGTTNTRDTVVLTRHAQDAGATGAASVGPFYFRHNHDNLMAFYGAMRKSVDPAFPLYLYHNPAFSGYEMALATVRELKNIGINGVKDATFNIMTLAAYMRELAGDDFDVALGTEAMWASARALGVEAFIPGLANAFPEICRRMHREGMAGEIEKCRETQFKVNRMRDIMYLAKSTQLAVYAMLAIRDIVHAYPRSPFVPARPAEVNDIRKALQELEVI